jgi:hypothetical protein
VIRPLTIAIVVALSVAACSSGDSEPVGYENPERAVVAWFEAIDAGNAATASRAVNDDSLAIILSIENDADEETTATYLAEGVPSALQASYWKSFASGFSAFASRPISTLTVGQSTPVAVEGAEFASVPIASGPNTESVVYTKRNEDGTWQVDLVATLSDGFSSLIVDEYDHLGSSDDAQAIRDAYRVTVAPAFWAAMADGTFGDDFNRVALTFLGQLDS